MTLYLFNDKMIYTFKKTFYFGLGDGFIHMDTI